MSQSILGTVDPKATPVLLAHPNHCPFEVLTKLYDRRKNERPGLEFDNARVHFVTITQQHVR